MYSACKTPCRFIHVLLLATFLAISAASFSCSARSVKVDSPIKAGDAANTLPATEIKDTVKKVDISVKMGVIDLQKVAEESLAGKKSMVEYNILAKAKQVSIEGKNKAIEKLGRELEQRKPDISEKALQQKLEELEKLETELSRFSQDAEAELAGKYDELYSNMLRDILELTGKIGAAENYTVIIDKGGILYCDENLNITDPFIKQYDELKEADKLKSGTQPEK